jgi:alpha-tubulin suppressor-like RCC1 family protein
MGQTTSAEQRLTKPSVSHKQHIYTELLVCGSNHCGELGLNTVETTSYAVTFVKPIAPPRIKYVAGGGGFTYIVTYNNQVWSAGFAQHGVIAQGDLEERHLFTRVMDIPQGEITFIDAGFFHCCIIIDNCLYSVGDNSSGQLGLKNLNVYTTFQKVPHVRVSTVACGGVHTMVLTTSGVVMGCGSNSFGQLSLSSQQTLTKLTACDVQFNEPIIQLVCGLYHSIILTETGKMFVTGHNQFGQLCLGHVDPIFKFTFIDTNLPIKRISCGNYHTVVIDEENYVFGSGNNCSGQLGLNDNNDRYILTPVGIKARDVSAHLSQQTFIISLQGKLLASGWNMHGPLGLGHNDNVHKFTPVDVHGDVLTATCGAGHSLVVLGLGALTGLDYKRLQFYDIVIITHRT